ncbi:MAG: hypothetical protein FRX49_12765 [Trebouxia sp. A1-2]|nr:MAG: hypothetical protein FRX49_13781 [Trebouxia sp. A1-2]KAA6417276.1 MAG: hypothetical protein FRX49_12765 [Trebouxia sp. A1-2]
MQDVRRFVNDHASTGWYTNIKDLHHKALDHEINGLASGRDRDNSPVQGQKATRGATTVTTSGTAEGVTATSVTVVVATMATEELEKGNLVPVADGSARAAQGNGQRALGPSP